MIRHFLTAVALAVLAGCSGSSLTDPYGGGGSNGNGSNGGGSTGGGSTGGGIAPATAAVTIGNIFFKSGHNGSVNPAVDTVAAGATVTWTWTNTGTVHHSVESLGTPSFTSGAIQAGDGSTYKVKFSTPGTYQYDCGVHGTMMSGTIVVQ